MFPDPKNREAGAIPARSIYKGVFCGRSLQDLLHAGCDDVRLHRILRIDCIYHTDGRTPVWQELQVHGGWCVIVYGWNARHLYPSHLVVLIQVLY